MKGEGGRRCERRFAPGAVSVSLAIVLAILAPAWVSGAGRIYMTPEQALASAFPASDRREEVRLELDAQERGELSKVLGRPEPPGPIVFHRFLSGGTFLGLAIIQEGMGKHEPMTFMVVLDGSGKVLRVAMLVYRESRGGEVAQERWLKQFAGKHSKDQLKVGRDVVNYAGATISCQTVAWGVKRACLLFEKATAKQALAGGPGTSP